MPRNFVQVPNCEAFQRATSTAALKPMSLGPAPSPQAFRPAASTSSRKHWPAPAPKGLSLHAQNSKAFRDDPLISSGKAMLLLALTVGNKEKSNSKGRESDDKHTKTNSLVAAGSNGRDVKKSQSNSMASGSKETSNPTQHDKHKGNHSSTNTATTACSQQPPVTSKISAPNIPWDTANLVDDGYAIDDCFNNDGDGEQDFSYAKISGSEHKRAFNNKASGLQALYRAEIYISGSEDAFNNSSSRPQTIRKAKIDYRGSSNELNASDNRAAIRSVFNNRANGTQNYDGANIYRGENNRMVLGHVDEKEGSQEGQTDGC